ncbi:hypothetical protein PCC6912_19540 [Chlorogloeopsis fritschii PCC 6912]|uniref:Uncharacterized protein n=1 Tax=Chlorogloeopsis fritschii PCC 6912 TaxID=211165 RepID=A0A433NLA4_CHLFR|nr:hypothetical protein PCC6912_19540 [Chlorogloeopsis fritschii PCC 6912]
MTGSDDGKTLSSDGSVFSCTVGEDATDGDGKNQFVKLTTLVAAKSKPVFRFFIKFFDYGVYCTRE